LNPPHWHILGAGALGCLFASLLQRAGTPVTLLLRSGRGADTALLRVETGDGGHRCECPVAPVSDAGHIGHLLVTTKAGDVVPAMRALAHRLDRHSQVLLLANGMGFAEVLTDTLPGPRWYLGTTTEAAYRLAPFHIRHAGRGVTRLGRPGLREAPPWFATWALAVNPSRWEERIEEALWQKLAINCAINPVTALHRCCNGELARRPALTALLGQLCDEIRQVSLAAGFGTATQDLPALVDGVIAATAANRSSMLQDIEAGRSTEIDYITGHLVALARRLGVPVPANEALLAEVKALAP